MGRFVDEKIICTECQEQGLKSIITDLGGMETLLGIFPFYDEDGNYHYHDTNTATWTYKCSNGHQFSRKLKHTCTCGWIQS